MLQYKPAVSESFRCWEKYTVQLAGKSSAFHWNAHENFPATFCTPFPQKGWEIFLKLNHWGCVLSSLNFHHDFFSNAEAVFVCVCVCFGGKFIPKIIPEEKGMVFSKVQRVGIYEASNKEIIEEKETKGNNMCNTKWYIGWMGKCVIVSDIVIQRRLNIGFHRVRRVRVWVFFY